jgi:hypothetical protein
MTTILRGLAGYIVHQDDIIVFGCTKREHNVLQRLRERGIKLNDKCEFNVSEIQALGHVIDANGLRPNPELVTAIVDCPVDKGQLHPFLGMAGYYAKFVQIFYPCVPFKGNFETGLFFLDS